MLDLLNGVVSVGLLVFCGAVAAMMDNKGDRLVRVSLVLLAIGFGLQAMGIDDRRWPSTLINTGILTIGWALRREVWAFVRFRFGENAKMGRVDDWKRATDHAEFQ